MFKINDMLFTIQWESIKLSILEKKRILMIMIREYYILKPVYEQSDN